MVEQLLNSLLFYFFSTEFRCREKVRESPNYLRSVLCWDLFLYFWGHFGVTNGQHSRSALYRAENICDQLFVWTFSLLIMGDTGRPRYTGLRSLSVRGITALQCSQILLHCCLPVIENSSSSAISEHHQGMNIKSLLFMKSSIFYMLRPSYCEAEYPLLLQWWRDTFT